MAGMKITCPTCAQRILVPEAPPQSKAGTNKTTLGKVIPEDDRPAPQVVAAPDADEERPSRRRKSGRREDDDYEDERDDYDDRRRDDRRDIRCPFCDRRAGYYVREEISQQGWLVFIILLLFFFPLCFLGLFMKEKVRYCRRCNSRLDRREMRF
jgi:DNA-directed RNA polymerase subunit RPC12/RpoP